MKNSTAAHKRWFENGQQKKKWVSVKTGKTGQGKILKKSSENIKHPAGVLLSKYTVNKF
jgi:hypothetical protein